MSKPETIGTHDNVTYLSKTEHIPVHRRVAAAIGRVASFSEEDRVAAGVMRAGEAQEAQVAAQYGPEVPNDLNPDQQNRAAALVAQKIREVR